MEYIQIKTATLAHSRALLSVLANGEFRTHFRLPKRQLSHHWTKSRSARAAIVRACKDLPKLVIVDHRRGGREFRLLKEVRETRTEVELVFNFTAENLEVWSDLRESLLSDGIDKWFGIRSRYTLGLILAQRTMGASYFDINQLREITGCLYSYELDSSFVRDVMKVYSKDLGYMNEASWVPNYEATPRANNREAVVGYHVV
ncbi:hypothetical protein [Vibrio owensii]|uniref:hypothetical protein n=1 Tax=Vibrio owensii TaxID=696485 RepID=UPI0018F11744|nr:hypothetical protein [Vibrio owensii]